AAFVETDVTIATDELTTYLRDRLPYYMVPDTIRTIAAIPRLPNGKIDRLWLSVEAQRPTAPARETERPRTPVEARIAAILEESRGHDRIGLDDNFFALGGTSLLGMRYLARINDVCNVRLGAAALLRAPTVAAMAQLVADQSAGAPIAETRELDVTPAAPI